MNFKPNFKTKEDIKAEQPKYEPVTNYMVNVADLVTFKPAQTIQEAIDIIIEKRISGAPVLDDNGKLVGMLSEKDCLRIIVDQAYHNLPIESKKVSDYMTAEVKTVSPEHDVVSAANLFLHTPIRRMPVVENGVLKGQISRRDILRAAKNFKVTTW
ncbi:MAG: CBS domain-containing protein [Cyclobacteriaceae bacterium]|nr:CBS domain-containing protein [Cyclobacteriaceae bacterium]